MSNALKVDGMSRICEQAELSGTDLMVFSPPKLDLLAGERFCVIIYNMIFRIIVEDGNDHQNDRVFTDDLMFH